MGGTLDIGRILHTSTEAHSLAKSRESIRIVRQPSWPALAGAASEAVLCCRAGVDYHLSVTLRASSTYVHLKRTSGATHQAVCSLA
eukprot:scaffold28385_cov27-Tisochrysis_lutea.AAC.4